MNTAQPPSTQGSLWARDIRAGGNTVSLPMIFGFVCLALAWLVPGVFVPWTAFRREAIAGVAFVLLAAAALEHSKQVTWPRLALLALAIAGIPLIQWALGQVQFRSDAFVCALYLGAFALSLCVGATLANGARQQQLLTALMLCLIVVAVVSCGIAFSQWLGPGVYEDVLASLPPGGRPYANMGQPNHLATQLFLGVVAVLYLYEHRRIAGLAASIAVGWMGWGIVLTQSRAVWLATALLVLWWLIKHRRAALRTPGTAIAAGCLAFAALVWLLPTLETLWSGSNGSANPQVRLATGTRPGHWLTLWEALMRSPWYGYGWNQVATAQFEVAGEFPGIHEWTAQSHNLVLDLLIYNGLPLGLAICSVVIAWFALRVRACRSSESWCLLMMLFAVFSHALLEYPLHFSYYLLPAGLLMGFLSTSNTVVSPAIKAPRFTLIVPVFALTILASAIGIEYMEAEDAMRTLALSENRIGPSPSELPRADWYFVDGWAAYHSAIATPVTAGMPADQFENLRRVARRYPYPNVLELYARASALNGQPEAAKHALVHACKVHTVPICERIRRRWEIFQSQHARLQSVPFPAF